MSYPFLCKYCRVSLGSVLQECLKYSNKGTTGQKHLSLTGDNSNPYSSSDGTCIPTFLGKCKILKMLSLRRLLIPKEIVTGILNGVTQNKTLQELDLSYNDISDDFAPVFHKMLCTNKILRLLSLKGNSHISDQTAIAVADALKQNSSLTSLDLSETSVTINGLSAFSEAISVNRTVASFNIGPIAGKTERECLCICRAFEESVERAAALDLGSWIIRGMYRYHLSAQTSHCRIYFCLRIVGRVNSKALLPDVSVYQNCFTLRTRISQMLPAKSR